MASEKTDTAKGARPRGRNWTGAAVLGPGELLGALPRGSTTFTVWRCPAKRTLYLVTDTDDLDRVSLPAELRSLGWVRFKSFRESHRPRVGLSEAEAKRDIAEYGFHLKRIAANTTERVAPPYGLTAHKPKSSAA